ncbi:MAG: hypothetical protein H0W15_11230 [Gemmatimonadales bacterium]|nr:hypothetical protein [Gemmatimonadales bacterium]
MKNNSDEFQKSLRRAAAEVKRKADALTAIKRASFAELFPRQFMEAQTDFSDFNQLIEASGLKVETQDDFNGMDPEAWDKAVATHTRFANWTEMKNAAGAEFMKRKWDQA